MTSLFNAVNQANAYTANGALTNSTTLSANLDFFSQAASSRGKDIRNMFVKALEENEELALRILQWLRDCRGGAGERKQFLDLFTYYVNRSSKNHDKALKILSKLPELGYWKDVLSVSKISTMKQDAFSVIVAGLMDKNALCAKYLPRKNKVKFVDDGIKQKKVVVDDTAHQLRTFLGLEHKEYRKLLVSLSNTVEQKMCARRWGDINFGHVPSLASSRYQKAFQRNAMEHYDDYVRKLETGEAKINASVIYPYQILQNLSNGLQDVANAQWKALPDYIGDSEERILPMADVSGSMCCSAGGTSATCMDVCISLAMYVSERGNSVFKDTFLTFTSEPDLVKLSGKLNERYNQLSRAHWGMSTNLERAFKVILDAGMKNKVPEDQMPTMILIMSDMQFDRCVRGTTLSADIKRRYEEAGYKLPKIVFWNLNASTNNNPVNIYDDNTACVSGFSPSIMKSILSAKEFNPLSVMYETVMIPRYDL